MCATLAARPQGFLLPLAIGLAFCLAGCARDVAGTGGSAWSVEASRLGSLKDDAPASAPARLVTPASLPAPRLAPDDGARRAAPRLAPRPITAAAQPQPQIPAAPPAPGPAAPQSPAPAAEAKAPAPVAPPPAAERTAPASRPGIPPPAPEPAASAPLTAKDQTAAAAAAAREACANPEACLAELRRLVDSPTRDWVLTPAPPQHYANGMRLFAFRALRKTLTCKELAAALAEISQAERTFSSPVAGVSPQQAARILAVNATARGELKSEQTARC